MIENTELQDSLDEFKYLLGQLSTYCETGESLRRSVSSVSVIAKKTVERQFAIWGKADPRDSECGPIWPIFEILRVQMIGPCEQSHQPQFSFAVGDGPYVMEAFLKEEWGTSSWDWIDLNWDAPISQWDSLASRIKKNAGRWIEYVDAPGFSVSVNEATGNGFWCGLVVPENETALRFVPDEKDQEILEYCDGVRRLNVDIENEVRLGATNVKTRVKKMIKAGLLERESQNSRTGVTKVQK